MATKKLTLPMWLTLHFYWAVHWSGMIWVAFSSRLHHLNSKAEVVIGNHEKDCTNSGRK